MKKLHGLLTGIALLASGGMAQAVTFTVSDAFGPGVFGTATGTFLADGTTAEITFDMSPNYIIDTGAHYAATFSLAGGAFVVNNLDTLNTAGLFSTNPHTSPAAYPNAPFGLFTDAISGNCGPGGSVGCGSTLVFDIANFAGFLAATNLYNGALIFAAVDILNLACVAAGGTACTGVVGLTAQLVPTPFDVPPEVPIPGAVWLFASGLAGLGVLARRRKKQADQLVAA